MARSWLASTIAWKDGSPVAVSKAREMSAARPRTKSFASPGSSCLRRRASIAKATATSGPAASAAAASAGKAGIR